MEHDFEILKSKQLIENADYILNKEYFVLTTNVDGQFENVGFNTDRKIKI